MHKRPCAETVRAKFHYDPETGHFHRKKAFGKLPAGSISGCLRLRDGYWFVSMNGRQYLAHRLAWLYVHGEWPACQIDHANGDRRDNRLSNLRLCTISENRWNSKIRERNTSGYKGVTWDVNRKKWMAQIMAHRRKRHLGRFNTREEAHAAYQAAALKLHGEFARFE